jgi:hypothetical protein
MNNWISVKRKLPAWYEWVLVYSPYSDLPLSTRRVETGDKFKNGQSKWSWDWSRYVNLTSTGVSHWMEKPTPPKGQEIKQYRNYSTAG